MKMTIESYISDSQEIKDYIDRTNNVFLISGCGTGKSFWVREYLMKKYKTLNVNFIEAINKQNFSESHLIGGKAVREKSGSDSASINVKNLGNISDDVIRGLDLLVIDEIQELWFSSCYRAESGDNLVKQIKRFQSLGSKIIVISGTPIVGTDIFKSLGFETLEIQKKVVDEKDRYKFTFIQGLNYNNIGEYTKSLIDDGKTVIIKNDNKRDHIMQRLNKSGIDFESIQSDDKNIKDSSTKYLIDNQVLPGDVECFISTKILCGGLNINDKLEDKEIIYICFAKEIEAPQLAIQLAGRSRKQKKNLIIGYDKDSDFDINYSHTLYDLSDSLIKTDINNEKEVLLKQNYNSCKDWINYFKRVCSCDTYFEACYLYTKDKVEPIETDWKRYINLLVSSKIEGTYNESFKVKVCHETWKDPIESEYSYKYIFCTNKTKGKLIIKALDLGFKIESYDEEELDILLSIVGYSKVFSKMLDKPGNEGIKEDIINGVLNFDSATLTKLFSDTFQIKKIVNGKEVEVSKNDKYRMIDKPLMIISHFRETFLSLIQGICIYNIVEEDNLRCNLINQRWNFISKFDKEYMKYQQEQIDRAREISQVRSKASSKRLKVISEGHKKLVGLLNNIYNSCEEAIGKIGVSKNTLTSLIKNGYIIKL